MNVDEIGLPELNEAFKKMKCRPELLYTTPLIAGMEQQLKVLLPEVRSISLKLESFQCTGSFKLRGVLHQFLCLSEEDRRKKRTLVTMSAGNYGKAFAFVAQKEGMPAIVYMPDYAPLDRKETIESYGATVIRVPVEKLIDSVHERVKMTNGLFFHSYDDPVLIMGNASAGLELVQQVTTPPNIVFCCCGGGGLLAGVSTALKLSGWEDTQIYGVVPANVPTMYHSFEAGKVVSVDRTATIAAGLAPPTVGESSLQLIKKHTNGILLVTEEELRRGMKVLYDIGLVVEPSGAAAFAALLAKKVPDLKNSDVVVYVTGGNVSTSDLRDIIANVS